MADDFARLVFQANPASSHDSQYQRAHDGYAPSASPHDSRLLFFDDEDEGDPPPQILPFPALTLYKSRRAIYTCPARLRLWLVLHSAPKASLQANGTKQGWTFDQDEPPARPPQPPSRNQEGFASKMEVAMEKEQVLTGERIVAFNNSDANANFLSNYVSTTKCNIVTFVPKFLFG